jgi:two-component system chemotaxis response regulator CheB
MEPKKTRVLIVEDSTLIAHMLTKIFNATKDIEVIGVAGDGEKAVSMTEKLRPDVVTMDIHLPKMNGYEATKRIMAFCPTPILVVSSSHYALEINMTFNAIYCGAIDVIEKGPFENKAGSAHFEKELLEKVRLLAHIKVIHKPAWQIPLPAKKEKASKILDTFIVGIAASTGGPRIIHTILSQLPKTLNFCVLIVQHIAPTFTEGFAQWLSAGTFRDVQVAKSGSPVKADLVYVAPGNAHLKLSPEGSLVLSHTPPEGSHCPSANVLFRSIAEVAGRHSLGVILSGMGVDGLEGLKEMRKQKAHIIAQDEASCVVYGMPKACVDAGIVTTVAAKDKIAEAIMRLVLNHPSES